MNHGWGATSAPLRLGWEKEAQFTRWIASSIHLLGYVLDLRLSVLSANAVAADRIADLFPCDEEDGSLAIIGTSLNSPATRALGRSSPTLPAATQRR